MIVVKIKLLVGSLILLLLIFVVAVLYFAKTSSAVDSLSLTNYDLAELSRCHITLERANIPPRISQAQAILSVTKGSYHLAKISIGYYLVTDPSFQAFSPEALVKDPDLKESKYMDRTPAYIVSIQGLNMVSATIPYGYKGKVPVHHVLDVVIDAKTGEQLMLFSYE